MGGRAEILWLPIEGRHRAFARPLGDLSLPLFPVHIRKHWQRSQRCFTEAISRKPFHESHGEERNGKSPRADLHRMRRPHVALHDLAEDRAEATDQRLPLRSLRLDYPHLERKEVSGLDRSKPIENLHVETPCRAENPAGPSVTMGIQRRIVTDAPSRNRPSLHAPYVAGVRLRGRVRPDCDQATPTFSRWLPAPGKGCAAAPAHRSDRGKRDTYPPP